MRLSLRQALALLIGLTAVGMATATVVILVTQGNTLARLDNDPLAILLAGTVSTLAAASSGAVIIWHRPSNWVGWGMTLALLAMFSTFGPLYAGYAYENDLPFAVPVAIAAAAVYLPSLTGIVVLFTTFPNDRPQSWVGKTLIGMAGVAATLAFLHEFVLPGTVYNLAAFDVANPFGIDSLEFPVWDVSHAVIIAVMTLSAIGLVARAIRSRDIARQQFKWLALIPAILLVERAASSLFVIPDGLDEIALTLVPVAVLMAITRYRLYDVDRIINRTLVYSLLSIVLAAVFAALVIVPQTLILGPETTSAAAVALVATATLTAASAFNPLRRQVQRAVDRRFNRTRYDSQLVVAAFRESLREPLDLDTLVDEMSVVVGRTLAPTQVGIWTGGRGS